MLTGKKQRQTGLAEKRNRRQILNGQDQQYLKNEDWEAPVQAHYKPHSGLLLKAVAVVTGANIFTKIIEISNWTPKMSEYLSPNPLCASVHHL